MPTEQLDLEALLEMSARGDREAFAELYDATSAQVLGLALQVLRDPAEADFVAQETFVEVWRRAGRHDPSTSSVRGWIFTLAHRRAVDRLRAPGRPDPAPLDLDRLVEVMPPTTEGRRVEAAMRRLTDAQRLTIGLTYLDGFTCAEAARHIGIPLGVASARLRGALLRLRLELIDARFA